MDPEEEHTCMLIKTSTLVVCTARHVSEKLNVPCLAILPPSTTSGT